MNLRLGEVDGLYHHHYGIGDVDWSVLGTPMPARGEQAVTDELHRLESAQAELLLDHLGHVAPEDADRRRRLRPRRHSMLAHQRFGCHGRRRDALRQTGRLRQRAGQAGRGIEDRVRSHVGNMLATASPRAPPASWNNESTMYVDLMISSPSTPGSCAAAAAT